MLNILGGCLRVKCQWMVERIGTGGFPKMPASKVTSYLKQPLPKVEDTAVLAGSFSS